MDCAPGAMWACERLSELTFAHLTGLDFTYHDTITKTIPATILERLNPTTTFELIST